MSRQRKHFMISDTNIKYLDDIKKKYGCRYKSEALEIILREHKNNSSITGEYLINSICENVSENIKCNLQLLKKACNSSDKNTQILIELLNGLYFKNQIGSIITTDEDIAPAIEKAQKVVDKRIINKRITKLDKTY